MQTVYLNGDIAKFGHKWETDCANIRDIFKLIECQTPEFRKYLIEASEADIHYEIQRGEELLESVDELLLSLNNEDIIITEVPSGSKSGGAKLIAAIGITLLVMFPPTSGIGAALGAQIFGTKLTLGTILTTIATNLAMTGINQLLAPGPEVDTAEENKGYLFNGPINNIAQGMPIPVAYGELIVGGSPISVNYETRPIKFGTYTNDTSDDGKMPINIIPGSFPIPGPDNPPSDPGTDSYPIPEDPLPDLDDFTLPMEVPVENQ